MQQFEPITAELRTYMTKYAKGKQTWAFWSGKGAMQVAKRNSDVCLEKSALGGLFDGININGNWDTQMWAALSKAYAAEAANNVERKDYRGFVGQGSSAEASIFNQVEQPQFVGMLNEKQKASLKLVWYAVALDPKDPSRSKPDPTCSAGGMEGVMASGDRPSMVAMAESVNAKRQNLFAETGQVVPPDQVDAPLGKNEAAAAKDPSLASLSEKRAMVPMGTTAGASNQASATKP